MLKKHTKQLSIYIFFFAEKYTDMHEKLFHLPYDSVQYCVYIFAF